MDRNFLVPKAKATNPVRTVTIKFSRLYSVEDTWYETTLYSQRYVNGAKPVIYKPPLTGREQPTRDPSQMIYTAQSTYRFTIIEHRGNTVFWEMSPSEVFDKVDQFYTDQKKRANCVTFKLQPNHPKHPVIATFY